MKIGAHVSIEGGLENSIRRAQTIGAECIQIFGSSPRSWKPPTHSLESVEKFKKSRQEVGIDPVFLHTIYLVNLASADDRLWSKSVESVVACLQLAQSLGAAGVVTHLGSRASAPESEGERRVCLALEKAIAEVETNVPILMETSAGAGSFVGGSFESLGRILSRSALAKRVQVCLDTAHVFAAGYDISSEEGLRTTLATFDKEVGLDRLMLVHVNDSKVPLGSHVDRHENIGRGTIGVKGLKRVLRSPVLRSVPFVTEVPGLAGDGPGAQDMAVLRQLASDEA